LVLTFLVPSEALRKFCAAHAEWLIDLLHSQS
jgi:hypothetical protein